MNKNYNKLDLLDSKYLLTNQNVSDLKTLIFNKYPSYTSQKTAQIFADGVNKILDRNLSYFSEDSKIKLKENIIRKAILKGNFSVSMRDLYLTCMDVYKEDAKIIDEFKTFSKHSLGILPQELFHDNFDEENMLFESNPDISEPEPDMDYRVYLNEVADSEREALDIVSDDIQLPEVYLCDVLKNVEVPHTEIKSEVRYIKKYNIKRKNNKIVTHNALSLNRFKKNLLKLNSLIKSSNVFLKIIDLPKRNIIFLSLGIVFLGIVIAFYSSNNLSLEVYSAAKTNNKEIDKKINKQEEIINSLSKIVEEKKKHNTNDASLRENSIEVKDIKDLEGKNAKKMELFATGYDLSVESIGKDIDNPQYGITALGTRATKGKTIAVDPSVINLGSKLYIVFPKDYGYLDGEYLAEDITRFEKGNIIDIFWGNDKMGEREINNQIKKFGVKKVTAYVY